MEVICKPVGPVQANCYIVMENGHALVIDPGDQGQEISSMLHAMNVQVDAILLTHAHFDHIGAVDTLMKEFDVDCYVNPAEFDYLQNPDKNSSSAFMGIPHLSLKTVPVELKEGLNTIGPFKVTAYFAPGHSAGSTIFEIGDSLFTGDVLFQESIGRTDLQGGSVEQMKESIAFLKSLTKNYTVYPGHGPSTTLDYEKTHNPYLLYNLL